MVQLYMTDDIAHLRNFPLYFYGQQFMGPLESYILAPFLRVFGSYYLTARFWNEIFYLALMVFSLGTVNRLFGRERSNFVLLFLSVAPFPVLFFTTILGYVEILPLAALSLILLLKVASEERGNFGFALALGFVSGLAMWCNPIFVIWLAPIGISLVALVPSSWKRKIPLGFALGLGLGLFPAWIHTLRTGTPMFVHTAGVRFTPRADLPKQAYLFLARMKYFLTTSFFEPSLRLRKLLPIPAFFVFGIFLISFAAELFSFIRNFTRQSLSEKIFHLFVLLPPFILAGLYISRDLTTDEGIRYFLPLVLVYPFTMAGWIHGFRSRFWKRAILISLVGILFAVSFVSLKIQNRQRENLVRVLQFLQQKDLRYGVGDLNSAYGLNALSRNRVQVTPAFYERRYLSLWNTVREKGPQFFIFEPVEHRYRKRLESEPQITKVVLGGREIFYGRSRLLEEILETKDPL